MDDENIYTHNIVVTSKNESVWKDCGKYKKGDLLKVKDTLGHADAGRVGKVIFIEAEPVRKEQYEWDVEVRYLLNFIDDPDGRFYSLKDMFYENELERATKNERFLYELGLANREEDV